MISKVTNTLYKPLGTLGEQLNELTSIDGVILTAPDFAPTIEDALNIETWINGIADGKVIPLNELSDYEIQSTEDVFYESAVWGRIPTKRGFTRYLFKFDLPFSVHRALQGISNMNFIPVRDGKICFYNKDGKVRGFTTSMVLVGRMEESPADGSTPILTPIHIDLTNYREWDEKGCYIEPEWLIDTLEPLIGVELEFVSESANEISVKVYSMDGYDSKGKVKKIPIRGLLQEDWNITVGTVTDYDDDFNGTFTFKGTFADGEISLKHPSELSGGMLLLGSKLRVLQFSCEENQTYVGQINEPAATSFTITEGAENFTVDASGLIEFISAPDYEVKNEYALKVTSNKGWRYIIRVDVTDVVSQMIYNYDTVYNYGTTY